jgi:hypothetical protein
MLYVKQLRNALKGLPDDTLVYLTDEFNEFDATLKSIEIAEDGVYLFADIEEEDEEDEEEGDTECDCEKCSFERGGKEGDDW